MWKSAIVAAILGLLQVSTSEAAPVTYTFDGTGSVTLAGVLIGSTYSVVFAGNTSTIDSSDNPYFKNLLTGTFTDGAVVETITATVESNSTLANIDFYDSTFTNGLGLQDNSLTGYALATSIGPIDAPPGTLTPTFGGGFFATAGGNLVFTGSDSLSFTADVSATPIPATLPLFATGFGALGLLGWRRKRKNAAALAA